MVIMDATTEIDKAGRLVVPKKMREALHLVPGTRLRLHQEGESIVLQTDVQHGRLYEKDGILIYDAGGSPSGDVCDWIETAREERHRQVLGALKR